MDKVNYIAILSNNIDALGRSFTAATYGAFAAHLTPLLSGMFVLYLIFWGFSFWQGRGEGNVMAIVFRLMRVAVIFSIATGWGPMQTLLYQGLTIAPVAASSILLDNIGNPGGGVMSERTIERDLNDFYRIALTASLRIDAQMKQDRQAERQEADKDKKTDGSPRPTFDPQTLQNPFDVPLASQFQSTIVWLSSAIFVGYAMFLILFAKIALLVMLALAPIFIILLMFQVPSRFFSGWLAGTIQVMLIPIFLYAFLAFYLLGLKDLVIALNWSMNDGAVPAMKHVAPFVLVCFSGMFLLAQVVPLAGRIAASTREWASAGIGRARNRVAASRGAGAATPAETGTARAAAPYTTTPEARLRDTQEQNAALIRLRRNR